MPHILQIEAQHGHIALPPWVPACDESCSQGWTILGLVEGSTFQIPWPFWGHDPSGLVQWLVSFCPAQPRWPLRLRMAKLNESLIDLEIAALVQMVQAGGGCL